MFSRLCRVLWSSFMPECGVAEPMLGRWKGENTMRTEFQAAIAQLIHEKGLPQDKVMAAVANALLAAYRKSTGSGDNIRIEVEGSGDVKIWASKRVVAQVHEPMHEVSLAEAQQVDPHAALGQQIDVESPEIFNKIPAQAAKQIILQR